MQNKYRGFIFFKKKSSLLQKRKERIRNILRTLVLRAHFMDYLAWLSPQDTAFNKILGQVGNGYFSSLRPFMAMGLAYDIEKYILIILYTENGGSL